MLFLRHHLQQASPFEDIAFDGFASFEYSQFFPFEHLIAVDCNSSFIIHHTDAALRRSGRMTERQKKRRLQLEQIYGRPPPTAVGQAVKELLEIALMGARNPLVRSDKHKTYAARIRQLTFPVHHRQTCSRRKRDRHNELFELNALDSFTRHCCANHRRETIAFSKRRQESAYRMSVFIVWKNFAKRRWEKKCSQTPAMIIGLADRVLTCDDILSRRLFPAHLQLPPSWQRYYRREVLTPAIHKNLRHELKYAF